MKQKISLLFALYFCQGLPGGFLAVALPVILRERKMPLWVVGLSFFLSVPWLLKIFWAPLVDKFSWPKFGRRKSWIIPAQVGMLAVTLALAFCPPERSLVAIAVLFLILNVFAATQDIGVDGLAVDILSKDEMGPGNTAQISGFKLGNLFGGGVLLALSGVLAWHGVFHIMFGLVAAAMLFLLLTNEKKLKATDDDKSPANGEPAQGTESVLAKLFGALKQQGIWFWVFLAYVKFGETFGGAMIKPMLVDNGFSRQLIGLLDGTIGSIATIVGSVLGGLACRKWGWRYSLAIFAACQGAFLIFFGFYANQGVYFPYLGIDGYYLITPTGAGVLNAFENLAGGGVGVSVFALAMGLCNKEVGASQFTTSQVIYMCGALAANPLSGIFSDLVGSYLPTMALGGLMAVSVSFISLRMAKDT